MGHDKTPQDDLFCLSCCSHLFQYCNSLCLGVTREDGFHHPGMRMLLASSSERYDLVPMAKWKVREIYEKGNSLLCIRNDKQEKKKFSKALQWQESTTTDVKFGMVTVELERRGHELPDAWTIEAWDMWQQKQGFISL